jgi:tRNA nucleotidyltransferase (CCA-adding enzyme)
MISFKEFISEEKISSDRWKEYLKSNKMLSAGVEVLNTLTRNNNKAYIVGGAVRDIIIGDDPHDIDIATNMPINKLESLFPSHDIGQSKDFGIITAKHKGYDFEIAQFREDGTYSNGRKPDKVKIVVDFKSDASRRDLTINAMGIDQNGNIIDFFNGQKDIKNKIIRTVGNPDDRFKEDKLRLLRVARFASKLNFNIDDKTKYAMKNYSGKLDQISVERIRDELLKTAGYGGKEFANMIRILDETNILKHILPEIVKMKEYKHDVKHHPEGDVWEHVLNALRKSNSKNPITNLSILLHDIGKTATLTYKENGMPQYLGHAKEGMMLIDSIVKRLKISNIDKEAIKFAALNHMKFHDILKMSNSKILKLMRDQNFNILLDVAKADAESRNHLWNPKEWEDIINKLKTVKEDMTPNEYEKIRKLINGKKIMEILNIKPGKELGKIISDSLEWVLDNNIKNSEQIYKYIKDKY